MEQDTLTYKEILEAHGALEVLSGRGYKSPKASKMIARMFLWTKKKVEEYEEARKLLIEGHAKKDDNGDKVPTRKKNEETGQWEDVPGTVTFEDHNAWQDAVMELLASTVATNGLKLTDKQLDSCVDKIEPAVYVGLGPLFDWGEDGGGGSVDEEVS